MCHVHHWFRHLTKKRVVVVVVTFISTICQCGRYRVEGCINESKSDRECIIKCESEGVSE